MNNTIIKNIIKYTIGLPFIIVCTFSFILIAPVLLFLEIGSLVLTGRWLDVVIDAFRDMVIGPWRPIP